MLPEVVRPQMTKSDTSSLTKPKLGLPFSVGCNAASIELANVKFKCCVMCSLPKDTFECPMKTHVAVSGG